MINLAVEYIRKEIASALGVNDADVIAGNVHILKEDNSKRGLYLSLVNLEEESSLRNTSHSYQQNNQVFYKEPPIFLNLFLLCSANFANYDASLLRLGQVIELFQSKRVFEQANQHPNRPFPASLEKVIFDYYNLNFEQLNHLWGVLGGTYLPSALYKVRLVKVQKDLPVGGPEILTVEVETKLLANK